MPVATTATSGGSSTCDADADTSGPAAAVHGAGELDAAAAGADPGDRRGDLDDVAGVDRLDEADLLVAGEQALVAVGADAQLGGDVAEQAQGVGARRRGCRRSARVRRRSGGGSTVVPRSRVMRAAFRSERRGRGSWRPRAGWCPGRRSGRRRGRRPSSRRSGARRRPAAAAAPAGYASRNAADISRVLCRCASLWVTTWLTSTASAFSARARGDQVGHGDLGAQVDHPQLPVVLQALLPREALDVEDRVDADGVRVGADAGADHDELAPQPLPHRGVDLLGGQQRVVPLDHRHRGQVDEVAAPGRRRRRT